MGIGVQPTHKIEQIIIPAKKIRLFIPTSMGNRCLPSSIKNQYIFFLKQKMGQAYKNIPVDNKLKLFRFL